MLINDSTTFCQALYPSPSTEVSEKLIFANPKANEGTVKKSPEHSGGNLFLAGEKCNCTLRSMKSKYIFRVLLSEISINVR